MGRKQLAARLLVGDANSSIAGLGHGSLISCSTDNSFHCTAGYVLTVAITGLVNGERAAHKAIRSFDLAQLLRNLDRLDHQPLRFLRSDQRLQQKTELHRAKFQKLHHLGEIFRRQCLPVRIDAEIIEICKAPFQRRRHRRRQGGLRRLPEPASAAGPAGRQCGSRYGLLHARRGDGRHPEKALIQARLARGSWFHPIVARIRPSGLESGSLT